MGARLAPSWLCMESPQGGEKEKLDRRSKVTARGALPRFTYSFRIKKYGTRNILGLTMGGRVKAGYTRIMYGMIQLYTDSTHSPVGIFLSVVPRPGYPKGL